MNQPKIQLLYIHGGMTFRIQTDYVDFLNKRPISIEEKVRWSNQYLDRELGELCQII